MYGFLAGQSAESIAQAFPVLALEHVYGAIAFYLAHRDDVVDYTCFRLSTTPTCVALADMEAAAACTKSGELQNRSPCIGIHATRQTLRATYLCQFGFFSLAADRPDNQGQRVKRPVGIRIGFGEIKRQAVFSQPCRELWAIVLDWIGVTSKESFEMNFLYTRASGTPAATIAAHRTIMNLMSHSKQPAVPRLRRFGTRS